RTGDLGYRRPDGCVVHLGRKDLQAKVKGHRVELAAVESALHELAGIAQAAVAAEGDPARGSRLVAYAAPRTKGRADVGAWRRALRSRLPAFMIPERFVVLDKLPRKAVEEFRRAGAAQRRGKSPGAVLARAARDKNVEHSRRLGEPRRRIPGSGRAGGESRRLVSARRSGREPVRAENHRRDGALHRCS